MGNVNNYRQSMPQFRPPVNPYRGMTIQQLLALRNMQQRPPLGMNPQWGGVKPPSQFAPQMPPAYGRPVQSGFAAPMGRAGDTDSLRQFGRQSNQPRFSIGNMSSNPGGTSINMGSRNNTNAYRQSTNMIRPLGAR